MKAKLIGGKVSIFVFVCLRTTALPSSENPIYEITTVWHISLQRLASGDDSVASGSSRPCQRRRSLATGVVRLDRRRRTDDGRPGGTEVFRSEFRRTAATTERDDRRAAAAETQPAVITASVVVSVNSGATLRTL